jgi:XTP/dITP diphosphohydrolase
MQAIVLASSNASKISDYRELLSQYPIRLVPQSELAVTDIEETGLTFVENALLKARNASHFTDLPVFGDDSGLVVDDLDGAPGLYSARYAGANSSAQGNIEKLLAELAKKPNSTRKARLYAVIVLLRYPNDPAPIICEGSWEGEILEAPCGQNGFGYLPIFFSTQHQRSAAELTIQERNLSSHRAQAFQQLLNKSLKKYV